MRRGFGGFFIECTTDFTIPYAFTCESRLWISAQASTTIEKGSRFKGRPAILTVTQFLFVNKTNRKSSLKSELVEVEV